MGERAADAVAHTMGSWHFIFIQTLVVFAWIGANVWLLTRPFDPYPFILLNLAFSTQAAYAAPVIQLGSNRREQIAAELAMHDHQVLGEIKKLTDQMTQLLECLHASPQTGPCSCLSLSHVDKPGF